MVGELIPALLSSDLHMHKQMWIIVYTHMHAHATAMK